MNGALAHLARATDWQSVGDRFESDMLHNLTAIHKGDIPQGMSPLLFYGISITYKHVHKINSQIFIIQCR